MTALAPTASASHKQQALQQALAIAARDLCGVDIEQRCGALGLNRPARGSLTLRFLGRNVRISLSDFAAQNPVTGMKLHPVDHLLILHYLQHKQLLAEPGDWISYREFPGGAFYRQPFRDRSVLPLVNEIGNDLPDLRARLARFEWRGHNAGDLGADIHVMGRARLLLVYHAADEEFSPDAEIFFSANLARVFGAEDAAALAGRFCAAIRERPCEPCRGCGMCDKQEILHDQP